jgi:hypothetical protein
VFVSNELKTHLESSPTIQLQSLVLAEWNMNMPDNISKIGNYRYRPQEVNSQFLTLPNTFDNSDTGYYYTGATDADVTIDGGFKNDGTPQLFTSVKEKNKLIYSLEDCVKPFRPRSGINKAAFFKGKYLSNSGANLARRPRYYMPARDDQFKYWTSYRTETMYKYVYTNGPIAYGFSPTFTDDNNTDPPTIKNGIPLNSERGIAKIPVNGNYYIDDAVPFVVYKNSVPANRLIVKMQTHVGDINLGPFTDKTKTFEDPFFGNTNKATPTRWKIQYLDGTSWTDAYTFNENNTREDSTPIISHDGYVELQYGIKNIPDKFKESFVVAETFSSSSLLPTVSIHGYAYLVIENEQSVGEYHIWNNITKEYESFTPDYGWLLGSEQINNKTSFVTDLTNPSSFLKNGNKKIFYREFQEILGLRIVVERMNKFDATFDLIEMSPRLVVDVSDKVIEYSVKKNLADLSSSSLPVGQLLASTGRISLFDDDQAFNENNDLSIVYKYIRKNIKFNFYEKILNVNEFDYWVPIKTLYSEGFPQANVTAGTLEIELRDFYFFLESMPAPKMLVTQVSISYAISLLLDYIGFSNYSFYRALNEPEPIIPYFFVAPDQNVAEVLSQLAISTQSAMFFDEYNNFIVMSKNYMLPSAPYTRDISMTLTGSNNQALDGIVENQTSGALPNILSIASENKKIYNNGKINYTTRYIQKSYGSIRQGSMIDKEKTWIYKPSLLWEVAGTDSVKTVNEIASKQSSYMLAALPLNSDLSSTPPSVVNHKITNNVIDLGENVYWLSRYQGYFYSNGEVIKFDAAQFNVTLPIWYDINKDGTLSDKNPSIVLPGRLAPTNFIDNLDSLVLSGAIKEEEKAKRIQEWRNTHRQGSSNVWITNNQEYQNYFKSIPFNGKIYPTGLVRIYSEPYYETVDGITRLQNGPVYQHGRAQFGTTIASHNAGISPYWSNNEYVRGCEMKSNYLFTTTLLEDISLPQTVVGAAGVNNTKARLASRSGTIKNFMASSHSSETSNNNKVSTESATIQSSALVINGPSFTVLETPINLVSYVYKELNSAYKHFGTRMRIIGKIENNENRGQTPNGSVPYYQVPGTQPNQNVSIGGSSGGLAVMLNPETNNGYYFEIAALTEENIESYLKLDKSGNSNISINNVVFYKVKKDASNNDAIPIKLYGGLAKIIVDDGRFTGQYRSAGEENTTVYDLAVEYENIGKTRRFYLYINGKLIKIVDDPDPLPIYNNMAPFVRGSSRCMFENIYAISQNYSQNTVASVSTPISKVFGETEESKRFIKSTGLFGDNEINLNESFRKYALSGVVQSTYLSGISAQQPPKYNIYFDEFGSIMRECSYFDIKYDRAYPALYAQISPTFNRLKGYTTSGFYADSYGAEFLIFNATDTALNLDETTGNYLRIQGITFTQDTTHELTVDEYFKKKGNLSNPQLDSSSTITSSLVEKEKFDNIKLSRMIHGNNEFTLDTPYIQTEDDAENLMGWIINKTMVPRKSIGVKIFSTPTIQLGDIVNINYKNNDGVDLVASLEEKYVVYNIEYSRSISGPDMTVYLAEV